MLWFLPFTLIVSATTPPAVFRPATRSLFRPKLSERAQPVLHMERLGDLAVLDGLNIDRHDLEALARMRHAKQLAGRGPHHFSVRRGRASPHGDYVSTSVPSTSGHRFSKSTSSWSPRSNRAWIRCCASGHVRAV